MTARLRRIIAYLRQAFWVRPSVLVAVAILMGWFAVYADRYVVYPSWLANAVYAGGASGARGVLSALATASLGVAGTIFSITIAALTLAAGQMGPRVLRNFTRDAGNQFALGTFVGTFAYALIVLRSVSDASEADFVPHLAVTIGFLLGLLCVGVLVWFVHHAAERVQVETVIEDVAADLTAAFDKCRAAEPGSLRDMSGAVVWRAERGGCLQQLDTGTLADFAAANECTIRLLFRPGQQVPPGVPLALISPATDGFQHLMSRTVLIGLRRTLADDPGFAVEQLTELAGRALSPGINDPGTAIGVVNTLTGVLCGLAGRPLPPGHIAREGRILVCWPTLDYAGVLDAMFQPIRLNAATVPSVLIRLLECLAMVLTTETDASRREELARHALLVRDIGLAQATDPAARDILALRHHDVQVALSGRLPAMPDLPLPPHDCCRS